MKSINYLCYSQARKQTLSMDFIGSIYNFKYVHENITNCEHIIPRSRFIKFENLKVLKYDLHNLYPCCIYLNSQRKNHKYTECVCQTQRPKYHFIPPSYAKGKIARTCLHFIDKYPELRYTIFNDVLDKDLLFKWHLEYEPDENELKRDWLIGKIQGDRNQFIYYPEKFDTYI